MMNSKSNPGNY